MSAETPAGRVARNERLTAQFRRASAAQDTARELVQDAAEAVQRLQETRRRLAMRVAAAPGRLTPVRRR